MRNVLKLALAIGTIALALAVGCGGGSNTPTDAGTDGGPDAGATITFQGVAPADLQILPQAVQILGAAFTAPDMTKFQVALDDPIKQLISGEASARLGNSPVTPVAGTTANHANYTVTGVDKNAVTAISPGLVVNVVGDNNTPKVQATTTSTGVATKAALDAAPAGGTLPASAPAFIIPGAFEAVMAQLSGQTLGANGYILAFIVDRTTGAPISGATLDAIPSHTSTYFNFAGQSASTTGPTDATGLVLITGPETGSTPITIAAHTAALPTCTATVTTNCLAPSQAGLQRGVAFVAPIAKQ